MKTAEEIICKECKRDLDMFSICNGYKICKECRDKKVVVKK